MSYDGMVYCHRCVRRDPHSHPNADDLRAEKRREEARSSPEGLCPICKSGCGHRCARSGTEFPS